MSEDNPDAAKKRRLQAPIHLGEAVALLGVIIAGLGLYVSYVQWLDHQQDKQAADKLAQQRAAAQSALVLRGEGAGDRIRLEPANPGQVVQGQVFYFPSPVRADPQQITGDGRLDAGWFAGGLKKALAGAADGRGEHELPVVIATTFVADGDIRTDASLYEVGYSIHPRLLQPAEVEIEGLALARRSLGGDLQGAVDAAWSRQAPAKPKP